MRARYRAALVEFDRLWESGASRQQPERMKQLLGSIEAFERMPVESSLKGTAYAACDA
jgi:hypothetical protein